MKSDEEREAIKEVKQMKEMVKETHKWLTEGPGSFKKKYNPSPSSKNKKSKSTSFSSSSSSSSKKKKTKKKTKKKSKSTSSSSLSKKSKLTKHVKTISKKELQKRYNMVKNQFKKKYPNEDFNEILSFWRNLSPKDREKSRKIEYKYNPINKGNPDWKFLLESNAMRNMFNQEFSMPARAREFTPLVRQQAVKGDEPSFSYSRL